MLGRCLLAGRVSAIFGAQREEQSLTGRQELGDQARAAFTKPFLGADALEKAGASAPHTLVFVGNDLRSSVLYEPDPGGKRRLMAERASAAGADGIIFATPSFCDPALLDQPMLRNGAEAAGIPCIAFKYAENTGQFQQFREQAGTFSDSIKLWGGGAA